MLNRSMDCEASKRQGRLASIPEIAYQRVFDLNRQGLGVYRITTALEDHGVYTSRSSVDRLLRGLPPYDASKIVEEQDAK